jgi:predicted nuclease of predicted toxin-antitoxin system
MIRFLADEDFDARILRGLLRRLPQIDVVRVQDVGLQSAHDHQVLAFAAEENRILLTHDVTTMSDFAYQRINKDLPMPGVFEIAQEINIGEAIEELILIAECSLENEWQGQVRFLPLR